MKTEIGTQKHVGKCHVTTEADIGVMLQLGEAGRVLPRALRGSTALLAS